MAGNPLAIQGGTPAGVAGQPAYGPNPQLGPNYGQQAPGTDKYGVQYANPTVPAAVGPLPVGAYIVGGFILVALSDTQIAPVIAAFLGAAIVYNGIKILGNPQGAAKITRTAGNVVTPPTPIYA